MTISTCENGVLILDGRDLSSGQNRSSDAAYTLAKALLAARLNQDAGACVRTGTYLYNGNYLTFEEILTAADNLFTGINFTGTGSYLGPRVRGNLATIRANALSLYGIIDG